ncbi:MAG TPA: pitrilysin family protein [Jatrophihabitans sp.]|jgi:predicted Zn-dependent peptidase
MSAPTTVPALTAPRRARKLGTAERTVGTGLKVIAIRKPGVPIAELRLRIPFQSAAATFPAKAALLSSVLLTGAGSYDRAGLAAAIQAFGADLSVSVDADRLAITGNVLANRLRGLLDLLAVVLTEAGYAADEFATERDREVERLTIARSRSGTIASEALAERMWGAHPYAHDLPQADAVAATTPAQVRTVHRDRVRPDGAVLVIVGDISPARVVDQTEQALAAWTGDAAKPRIPKLPVPQPLPLLVVDRPDSVQSSVRMGTDAVTRTDPRYPALQLANLVFGGYFSSRWTENIREDKGYTYGPHSRIDHHVLGSTLMLDVEVATEVTGPAMLETFYELGRIASLPVTPTELESVRQYAIGSLALSTSTNAGLASTIAALAAFDLGLDWIREHPARLARVTIDDVAEAAHEFLAPSRFSSVVVGDAKQIADPLSVLGPIEQ